MKSGWLPYNYAQSSTNSVYMVFLSIEDCKGGPPSVCVNTANNCMGGGKALLT